MSNTKQLGDKYQNCKKKVEIKILIFKKNLELIT